MILREASLADAPAIAALHTANWRQSYAGILPDDYLASEIEADRKAVWQERLSKTEAGRRTTVAEDEGGKLAGFSCVYFDHDPQWGAFLDNLHTSASARGKGYGLALLKDIASRTVSHGATAGLYLWVFEKNQTARAFYARAGAQEVERTDTQWALAMGEWRLRCHWSADDLCALAAD
ncbi:GNAT family N-acetyltransferase [Qipengyuania atrilutea]|uniref:GNAT family N-acetyltransferase n=1 Tax=Qipengyuania atrilutea TaxID=2744473 RepID=A0A850H6I4_9SPHN|nr:GNAT family N-acetyltransferase [Actirhodobacter atriluteus]NVD45772.1 GNAT family N-acetyltransferase [Actirhodobacter atriluteus]